jgi:predicted dehydrogenase
MTEKIQYGILSFAMGHAYPWAQGIIVHPEADLVGVWDENEERGKEAAERFHTTFYETADELLKVCDAVAITPTTDQHLALVEKAARAGVDIMLEKPLAMNVAEGLRMKEIIEETGVKFVLNFPKRFDDANIKLAEMVHSGRLGKITHVRIRHSHYIYRTHGNNTWFAQPEHSGGGALFDEGSHALDQLLWLLGEPESAYGVTESVLGLDCDDTGLAVFRYANGAIAEVISSGSMIAGDACVEVYGTEGTAIISATDMASREFAQPPYFKYFLLQPERDGWKDGGITPDFVQGYFHEKCPHHFIEHLKGRGPAIVDIDHALKTLLMAEKAYESSRTHQEIKLEF